MIPNLEVVVKKQMSFFGNFFLVRDVEEERIYLMKHMSYIDIKKKNAYNLAYNERVIVEALARRGRESSKKDQAIDCFQNAL